MNTARIDDQTFLKNFSQRGNSKEFPLRKFYETGAGKGEQARVGGGKQNLPPLDELGHLVSQVDKLRIGDDSGPVSYTHLDVYKRQSIDTAAGQVPLPT